MADGVPIGNHFCPYCNACRPFFLHKLGSVEARQCGKCGEIGTDVGRC